VPPETLDVSASLAIQSVDTTIATTTVCNHGPQLTVIAIVLSLNRSIISLACFLQEKRQ